ncbi:hypothetical protein QJS10_CPA08g00031 [Acorus calamus]|uniref:Uncharacterized protein n=1 Tax=Acorus calamus TaxID=4465 RepID=A0AAV9EDI8_ACOCL|nr:hypothetical protein QJS10_CPA08g00031 [Acorus calamus]
MKTSPMFLALLLLFLITTSLAEAIHAKRACNGTVAECDNEDEEWLMVRQLLQQSPSLSYRTQQKQAVCATSSGGSYSNNCFTPRNQQTRSCNQYFRCRS